MLLFDDASPFALAMHRRVTACASHFSLSPFPPVVLDGRIRGWGGAANGRVDLEAKSFVVHEKFSNGTAPKRLCCDFTSPPLVSRLPRTAFSEERGFDGALTAIATGHAATGSVRVRQEAAENEPRFRIESSITLSTVTGPMVSCLFVCTHFTSDSLTFVSPCRTCLTH